MNDRAAADLAYAAHAQTWRQLTYAVGGLNAERDGVCVSMTGIPAPDWNPGLVVARPVDVAAALAWGIAVRRDHGIPGGGYDIASGRHPGVEAELESLGHQVLVERPMMVAGVDDVAPGPRPPGLEVRPVATAADLAAFRDVQVRGFGTDPDVAEASAPWAAVRAVETAYAVGLVDGEPVTSALSVTSGDTVAVFGVTTAPAHRSRGYGRAITAAVVAEGVRRGGRLAWLQASSMGESLYAAMGFRTVERYAVWAGADG